MQGGGARVVRGQVIDDSSVLADRFAENFLNDLSAPAPVCTGGEPEKPGLPASRACIAWVNHNLP
jgi:hypothetical protein